MDRPGSFFTNEELFKADFAKSASEWQKCPSVNLFLGGCSSNESFNI
jgi:hypothetical protein